MERSDFKLKRFKLKDKQDVEAEFKAGKEHHKVEFTEAVHPKLFKALQAFNEVFIKQTGLNPNLKNAKVEDVEVQTVNLFDGADERSIMISPIVKWVGGYAHGINSVKMPLSVYHNQTKIDCEPLVQELEDRVYALLFENELAHEQQDLGL